MWVQVVNIRGFKIPLMSFNTMRLANYGSLARLLSSPLWGIIFTDGNIFPQSSGNYPYDMFLA